MIKSDFNRCFIFGLKMRIFGHFGPLWPFWPIYWPEIQKNMFHTFHICPGKPPQGGIQNLRFLGGRIIFTIENTSVKNLLYLSTVSWIQELVGIFFGSQWKHLIRFPISKLWTRSYDITKFLNIVLILFP